MNTKTQELVTAGYALAKGLDAESAKLVKKLADELAVQRVRADELNKQVVNLAVENADLKVAVIAWSGRERGMIFNAEMVRAILNGSKTQTRRIMKIQPETSKTREGDHWFSCNKLRSMVHVSDFTPGSSKIPDYHEFLSKCCPFGEIGDRIWVRETFGDAGVRLTYRADTDDGAHCKVKKWTPSIHMPRWASRILLEITSVRVERLQDISQADAIAEGMPPSHPSIDAVSRSFGYPDFSRSAFAQIWQSIYGEEDWQANPWVWVIEFKRVEASNG